MKRKHRQPVVSASLGAKEMPSGPPIELSAQGGQSYAVGPERKADPTLLTQHTTWDGWAGKRAKQERTLRTGDTAVVYDTKYTGCR